MDNDSAERKDIPGYEGRYWASADGQVGSHDRVVEQLDRWGHMTKRRLKGRVLKPGQMKKLNGDPGYLFVVLGAGGSPQLVHRLILLTFRGPCPARMRDGCHEDDDPTNNHLSNLRWDTHDKNQQEAVRNGRNHNANKTQCKNGHDFTPENTINRISANGQPRRDCRQCQADARERFYERHPEKAFEYQEKRAKGSSGA